MGETAICVVPIRQSVPPIDSSTRGTHDSRRLGNAAPLDDRIFDRAGGGPPIWFQMAAESKAGKNRLHLDVPSTERDDTLTLASRVDEPGDDYYDVVMRDPEGNEFWSADPRRRPPASVSVLQPPSGHRLSVASVSMPPSLAGLRIA